MCHYVQSLLLPRQLISTIFVQHFPFHEFNACCQEDLLPIVENYEFQYDGVEGVQLKAFRQETDKQNN